MRLNSLRLKDDMPRARFEIFDGVIGSSECFEVVGGLDARVRLLSLVFHFEFSIASSSLIAYIIAFDLRLT